MTFNSRWFDYAEDLLLAAETSMDPVDLADIARRFVSGGPDFAHDLGCSALVVHLLDQSGSHLPATTAQTVPQPQRRIRIPVGAWMITLVTDCQPVATAAGAKIILPSTASLTAAAETHYNRAEDIWRGISRAAIDGDLFSGGCQNVIISNVSWGGPEGRELFARFTVQADLT